MDVFITGGSGYIGSAVIRHLVRAGHGVSALVRSDASADLVSGLGAEAVRGDLTDAPVLTEAASRADAAIHLAATNDADGASADLAAARAILAGLDGKPYVHTSGVWVYGDTDGVATETSPLAPPAITAWRVENEREVLGSAETGGHPILVIPGLVWGGGAGLVPMFVAGDGKLRHLGDGGTHWSLVHVDDLAALYVLALGAEAGASYIGVADVLTQRDVAVALSQAPGLPDEVASWSIEEARAAFGALADAMALDQLATGAKARRELDWSPQHADARAGLAAGA